MAETYHVFDYRALPAGLCATLAVGLRHNSRVKTKLAGLKVPIETMLLASAVDRLSYIWWGQTVDGHNGRNRPQSVAGEFLLNRTEPESKYENFASPEDFEAARKRILGGT